MRMIYGYVYADFPPPHVFVEVYPCVWSMDQLQQRSSLYISCGTIYVNDFCDITDFSAKQLFYVCLQTLETQLNIEKKHWILHNGG